MTMEIEYLSEEQLASQLRAMYQRAEIIKSERKAADKARKARPPIRTMETVIRRHKKRSAAQ